MKLKNYLSEIQVKYSSRIAAKERIQVTSSGDVYKTLWEIWDKDLIGYQEAFVVLLLNRGNRVMGYRWISFGGSASTVVDIKHIFGLVLKCNACSIVLAHNHPSGNLNPSQADIDLTQKLKKGGELLDINILDHLIVTPNGEYCSFADEGHL